MISYTEFSKIKDNYCVCYFGCADEYLVQLRLLKDTIERHFEGLNLYFGCKDEKSHLLGDCSTILKVTQIKQRRKEFAHINELSYDGIIHPIEKLLKNSGITNVEITKESDSPTRKCLIVTKSVLPTRNLSETEINKLEEIAKEQGYYVSVDDKSINGVGWVLGVESPQLFEAAGQGIKTTLVETGIGTWLYKAMFPNGSVLHN